MSPYWSHCTNWCMQSLHSGEECRFLGSSISDLCQAALCREVLVVDLPQQPSLVVLVHLLGAVEQRGRPAALHAPLNLRSLTARRCTLDPHLCGKTRLSETEAAVRGPNRAEDAQRTAWLA